MKSSLAAILLAFFLMNCTSHESGHTDNLQVSWDLKTNFVTPQGGHKAVFSIRNNGDKTLGNGNWELYWNMMPRTIVSDSVKGPVKIEWINGGFYRMAPTQEFTLKPGETIDISYVGEGPVIKKTDAPLGLYMVFYDENGNESKRLPIDDYTIKPFDGPEQINRSPDDNVPIPSTQLRYEQNEYLSLIPEEQILPIIPTPNKLEVHNGQVIIDSETIIQYEDGLENESQLLANQFKVLGLNIKTQTGNAPSERTITLKLSPSDQPEAYQLKINADQGIVITGSDASGVFYGTRSLLALLPISAFGNQNKTLQLPEVNISDQPAFGYRGIHFDVARNFNSKATVKKLLDIMAFYKLNKLHFHLTEDEAWRLEIEELPELTEFGAYRGHTLNDDEYLQPAYGSGPFPDPDKGYGSGYYTREDYVEILQYANKRHIDVIPEINVPGHSRAAVKAMEYRYRKLMKEGKTREAEEYRLADPDDESVYRSAQWYTDNVICVCKPAAFKFYETVVDDIIEIYEDAGVPLKMIHTGGDEVPRGAWAKSPVCMDFLKDHPEIDNPQNLQRYFFRQVNEMLREKGLKTGGWEEVAMNFEKEGWSPNMEFSGGNVIPYIWNSLRGNEDLGYTLANADYPVVLCNVTNYYFDLAYNKDPEEPGLYWGGFVNERDPFAFAPYDLYKTLLKDQMGNKIDPEEAYKDMVRLDPDAQKNILGLQGELWSETLKGQDMLEYYYIPKIFGLAERAWSGQAGWASIENTQTRIEAMDKDWNRFINSVTRRDFVRLDRYNGGYNYRIAPPGAIIQDGVLHANVAYPGLEIRYTTDGSEPDKSAVLYEKPVKVDGNVIKLKAFNQSGRASRISEIKNN